MGASEGLGGNGAIVCCEGEEEMIIFLYRSSNDGTVLVAIVKF